MPYTVGSVSDPWLPLTWSNCVWQEMPGPETHSAPSPSDDPPLVARNWNGTPIPRRTTDGYVNATTMCKANGKRWNSYFETDRGASYIETLSSVTGIPVTGSGGLVQTRQGGSDQGTWIHPRVAIDLARWISPGFAVWMDGWFLEELERSAKAEAAGARAAVLAPAEMLGLMERSLALMERAGGLDERDQMLFRDMARTNLLMASGGGTAALPSYAEQEMALSDAWIEAFGTPLPRGKDTEVGKAVARIYREEHGQDPPKRTQYVDGAPRKVNSYRREWLLKAVLKVRDQVMALLS